MHRLLRRPFPIHRSLSQKSGLWSLPQPRKLPKQIAEPGETHLFYLRNHENYDDKLGISPWAKQVRFSLKIIQKVFLPVGETARTACPESAQWGEFKTI